IAVIQHLFFGAGREGADLKVSQESHRCTPAKRKLGTTSLGYTLGLFIIKGGQRHSLNLMEPHGLSFYPNRMIFLEIWCNLNLFGPSRWCRGRNPIGRTKPMFIRVMAFSYSPGYTLGDPRCKCRI